MLIAICMNPNKELNNSMGGGVKVNFKWIERLCTTKRIINEEEFICSDDIYS